MTRAESYVGHKEICLGFSTRRRAKPSNITNLSLRPARTSRYSFASSAAGWQAHASCPVQSILMAVGGVIYCVMSLDLIPDAVPVLGFGDDVRVINSGEGKSPSDP